MTKSAPKNNKLFSSSVTVGNILVTLIAISAGRAFPVPTGILAVTYFAVILGVTINKRSTAKEQGKDISKLTREVRSYAIWLVIIAAILGMNIWFLGGFKPKTIADTAYQSPTELASQGAQEAKSSTTLPYQVDNVTSLTDITSEGSSIQYHEQIKGADTSNLTEDALRDNVKTNVCANTDTKTLLNAGVGMEYIYTVYETGKQYQFTITQADCQ